MNVVTLTGKILGDIDINLTKEPTECKFKLRNSHYMYSNGKVIQTTIFCRATGSLANYCYNELWDGASVMISGNIRSQTIKSNNTIFTHTFVYCNIVTRLEQEEYN